MKLEIIEKAYCLNLDRIYRGNECCEVTVFAETRGKAKQKISIQIDFDEYEMEFSNEPMTFLNMPIKRAKGSDKVMYKDNVLKRYQVENRIAEEKENNRIELFLTDPNITHCYIGKRGTYYAWNYSGYTSFKTHAGVYPKAEAVPYCKNSLELSCIPISNPEHNELILNQIARLRKGLIS